MSNINIIDYQHEHQAAFEQLNRQWIEKYFFMEERDIFTLTRPDEAILKNGGVILMAQYDGTIAGTVALRKIDDSTLEFTKMAVDENFRRKGIAEALTRASFEKAAVLGADRIILYSHSSLTGAIALYSKMGFYHLMVESGIYRRADVKMEYWLKPEKKPTAAGIQIIRAKPEHAPLIAFIGRRSFDDTFGHLFESKQELSDYLNYTYSIPKIANSLKKETNVFFLAVAGEQPVGFVKLKRNSLNQDIDSLSQMELQKIYVLQEFHGKGAGEALICVAKKLARDEKACHLWLDTHISNHRGIRFYEKHGFRICGGHYFTIGSQTFDYHLMDFLVECSPRKPQRKGSQVRISGQKRILQY
ncbi:MAG TPA: GNAT family N-acetyltransferase [Chitinophagaceae bacterium]